ncbi:MAG: Rpn family recombination-promoting nuclease/putative transposase, partial [Candidatus Symbiothrix sp.]|nr:Rpn family recombination-promoting nuclease/putative transposase [Candidatus Symbiothrix sp.]
MNDIIEATYINPLTDFGFKLLFSEEKNKEFLIDFLNEIIEEEGCITDIEYQPTFQLGNAEQNRKAVFDIFCKNEKGEYFIVEMQKAKQPYFVDRSLFYSTCPVQNQAPQGAWNFQLKAVYTVALLDFVLFEEAEDEDYCIEHIYLMRDRTKTRYSKKLNFIFVELPKFK